MGRTGGGQDNICLVQMQKQLLKGERLAAEFIGQLLRPFKGAVGDHDPFGTVGQKVTGSQLTHLAGTDQQYGLVGQITEDLAGQFNSGKGDRYRR